MKGYIHTIDSLNTLNINLSNTLTEKTNKLNTVSNENQKYKKQNKDLQSKVALSSPTSRECNSFRYKDKKFWDTK